jgi:hypothetical protein
MITRKSTRQQRRKASRMASEELHQPRSALKWNASAADRMELPSPFLAKGDRDSGVLSDASRLQQAATEYLQQTAFSAMEFEPRRVEGNAPPSMSTLEGSQAEFPKGHGDPPTFPSPEYEPTLPPNPVGEEQVAEARMELAGEGDGETASIHGMTKFRRFTCDIATHGKIVADLCIELS